MIKPTEILIEGFFNNTCTSAEAKIVLTWFSTTEGRQYLESRFNEDIGKTLQGEEYFLDHDIQSAVIYQRINEKIENSRTKSLSLTQKWLRIAASVLLPLLIINIVLWLGYIKPGNTDITWQEVYVPKGERLQVMFQDGTKVWLNSDTKLRYPGEFKGGLRNIELQGEAYFNVKRNSRKPFVVQLKDLDIRVTGTSFNVKAYEDENMIRTTLDEGKISLAVRKKGDKKEYSLLPGQEASFSKEEGKVVIETSVKGQGSGWKENRIEFRDTPLSEVIRVLERWYNVEFRITDKKIEEYAYTITYDNESLPAVLKGLERITPVRCTVRNGIVEIAEKQP